MLRQLFITLLLVLAGQASVGIAPATDKSPRAAQTAGIDTERSDSLTWAELGMCDVIVYAGENNVTCPATQRPHQWHNGLKQPHAESVNHILRSLSPHALPLRRVDYFVYYLMQLRL